MSTLLPDVPTTEICPDTGLVCPFCGDPGVSFHSRTTVSLRRTVEWVGIFICNDSHTFYVSLKSLRSPEFTGMEALTGQSLAQLRRAVRAQVARLKEARIATRKSLDTNRQVRNEIAVTLHKINWKKSERPCGLPVQ